MEEVLADLRAAGVDGRESDIGVDFPEGFALWSMDSVAPADLEESAANDDERQVVEGVSMIGLPGAPNAIKV